MPFNTLKVWHWFRQVLRFWRHCQLSSDSDWKDDLSHLAVSRLDFLQHFNVNCMWTFSSISMFATNVKPLLTCTKFYNGSDGYKFDGDRQPWRMGSSSGLWESTSEDVLQSKVLASYCKTSMGKASREVHSQLYTLPLCYVACPLDVYRLVSEPDPHTQRKRRVWSSCVYEDLKSAEFQRDEFGWLMTV